MKLYPICLKLENINCLVVGGGKVALRKVKELIVCGAKITVLSPQLCKELKSLKDKKKFNWCRIKYNKNSLKKNFVVFAATNNMQVNEQIANDAFALNLLVNVVDNPRLCNFYAPAVIRRKDFLLSVSTQGKFPGMAKLIKKEFVEVLNKYAVNFKLLASFRAQINKKYKDKKNKEKIIKFLVSPKARLLINNKKIKFLSDLEKAKGIF